MFSLLAAQNASQQETGLFGELPQNISGRGRTDSGPPRAQRIGPPGHRLGVCMCNLDEKQTPAPDLNPELGTFKLKRGFLMPEMGPLIPHIGYLRPVYGPLRSHTGMIPYMIPYRDGMGPFRPSTSPLRLTSFILFHYFIMFVYSGPFEK